jgi:FO synthase
VAMARLILDEDVSLQAPPNLAPEGAERLLAAGLNDFGGISPVTPDYINPRHPWPHIDALGDACARAGFTLRPRASIYDCFARRAEFLDADLRAPTQAVQERLDLGSKAKTAAPSAKPATAGAGA